uniref:Uncharacterized protein n=1 Tax=Anguilla anguilla TaxID=7936 RepID=A0A0E9SA36_ANGAN
MCLPYSFTQMKGFHRCRNSFNPSN